MSEKAAAKTLAGLREAGARVAFLPFDISTKEGAAALAEAVKAELERSSKLVIHDHVVSLKKRKRSNKDDTPSSNKKAKKED